MQSLSKNITIGEKYNPIYSMNADQFKEYFELCVDHQMLIGNYTREEAISIERSNIKYYYGYFSKDCFEYVINLLATIA